MGRPYPDPSRKEVPGAPPVLTVGWLLTAVCRNGTRRAAGNCSWCALSHACAGGGLSGTVQSLDSRDFTWESFHRATIRCMDMEMREEVEPLFKDKVSPPASLQSALSCGGAGGQLQGAVPEHAGVHRDNAQDAVPRRVGI